MSFVFLRVFTSGDVQLCKDLFAVFLVRENSKPEGKSSFLFPLHPRTAGLSPASTGSGMVWFNAKLGVVREGGKVTAWQGQGMVWCRGEDTKHSREAFAAFPLRLWGWHEGCSGVGVMQRATRGRGKGAKILAKMLLGPGSPIAM